MTTEAVRRVVLPFVRRALSLVGFAGMVGVATQANANVEHERAALEKRLEIAREALREATQDKLLDPRDKAPIDQIAQRKRSNWNNWPNWNNWANWFNR